MHYRLVLCDYQLDHYLGDKTLNSSFFHLLPSKLQYTNLLHTHYICSSAINDCIGLPYPFKLGLHSSA